MECGRSEVGNLDVSRPGHYVHAGVFFYFLETGTGTSGGSKRTKLGRDGVFRFSIGCGLCRFSLSALISHNLRGAKKSCTYGSGPSLVSSVDFQNPRPPK